MFFAATLVKSVKMFTSFYHSFLSDMELLSIGYKGLVMMTSKTSGKGKAKFTISQVYLDHYSHALHLSINYIWERTLSSRMVYCAFNARIKPGTDHLNF